MSVSAEATGYEDTIQFGEKFTNTMTERFGTYLERFGLEVVDEARNNIQNNRNVNRGILLASVRILEIAQEGFEITVGSLLDYAKYVEDGRGPVIPSPGKTLSWIDKDSGERVFSKYSAPVNPSPFLAPAVISKMQRYTEIVMEGEENFLSGLGAH